MKIETTLRNPWLQYTNVDAPKASNYKLHVALPIGNFDGYNEKLRALLKGAVGNGIIRGFKILNRGDSHDLEKEMGGKDISVAEDKSARIYNNPVTIYLTETFNPAEIAVLCRQLEACLVNVPSAKEAHLSIADLSFTAHITFRQETLDGEYIPIATASFETLARLKKEGEISAEYHRLCKAVAQREQSTGAAESQQEKENNIKKFYGDHYKNHKRNLYSENVSVRFEAACQLLDIDVSIFNEDKNVECFLGVVNSRYRKIMLRYHPDKVYSPDAKIICEELSILIGDAKTILKEIVEAKQYNCRPQSQQERESSIKSFYNINYEFYNKNLKSENIHMQFEAACKLLDIDIALFGENKNTKHLLKMIASKYRIMARKYHSDKIQSKEIEKICDELFDFVGKAKTILTNIAENPTLLNKEALLKQHPYKLEHQYELKEPQFDPYYFIHLAESSALISIIENWTFETKAEMYSSAMRNGLNQGAVTLYTPYLTMYEKGDKRSEKLMPGYEAFYTLFLADAIPRRFDQGHFSMIFPSSSKESFSPALRWLLSKVLIAPEFITFMDSRDLIDLAKIATELGLVDIGRNATDTFIYYYIHHPDTLYGRRLQKFMAQNDFDKSKASEFILKHPQSLLSKVRDSVITELLGWNEPLKKYIFSSPQLMRKLPSYIIDSKFIEPLLGASTDALQDIQSIAVAYLILWGDASILSIFSAEALKTFKINLEGNIFNLPAYLFKAMQLKLDIFLAEKEMVHDASKDRVDIAVLNVIERVFLKNKSIISSLNKAVLIYLAKRLDLQLSDYILIINALYVLGEEEGATPILIRLAQELNLLEQYPDIRELRAVINGEEERLKNRYAETRQKRVNDLLNVSSEDLGDPVLMNEIRTELNALGAQNEVRILTRKQEKMFRREFYSLLRRLREGERTGELKEEFVQLRAKIDKAGCEWDDISKYGDVTEGYTLAEKPESKSAAKQNELYTFTEMDGCVHKLMCQKEYPYSSYKEKGFYLYRTGNPEKIYVLVSHTGYVHETLNLTDLVKDNVQCQEILNSIEWPKYKDTEVNLNGELVKFIIASCEKAIRNCYWIVELDWDGKPKICEGYFPQDMNLSDLEDMLRYTSDHNFTPRKDAVLGSIIWQLMEESIGIRRMGASLHDRINISPSSYGITAEMNLLDKLERLFFIHECLGSADTFYEYLAQLTAGNECFAELKTFDRDLIAQHLRDYADNELAVYIQGSRDAARGYHHRFIDFNDVKPFNALWQFYRNLDEQAAIEAFLPNAYQKLCDAYNDNPLSLQPIAKYIKIREHSKLRGKLEDRSAQLALCEIVRDMWDNSEHRIKIELDFFGKRKETPWLALMIFAINTKDSTNIALQTIYTLLADVLYTQYSFFMTRFFFSANPADSARCAELLGRIHDHLFLRDHFGLNGLTKEELLNQPVQKILATNLRQKVGDQQLPALAMQPVSPANALTHSESSKASGSSALAYTGSNSSQVPGSNALTYSGSASSGQGLFRRCLKPGSSSSGTPNSSSSSRLQNS